MRVTKFRNPLIRIAGCTRFPREPYREREVKMKKRSKILLCLASVMLALGLAACSSQDDSPEPQDESSTPAKESIKDAVKSTEGNTEGSPSSSSGASGSNTESNEFVFEDDCTDDMGNITFYALTELKGWQVATLLDQEGYSWNEDDLRWFRARDGAACASYKETGWYTIDTYNEMNEKGGCVAAMGFLQIGGYDTMEDALKGVCKCSIVDSYFDSNGGIAVFYGPSMKEYLCVMAPCDDLTIQCMIASQEAVGTGMLDEMVGRQVGGSFQEVWKTVTGEDSYGH